MVQVVVVDGERVASTSQSKVKRARVAVARETQEEAQVTPGPARAADQTVAIPPVAVILGGL